MKASNDNSGTRSPFLYYAIVLLSGGIFSYLWILLIARDVNRISLRGTFNLKVLSALVGLLFMIVAGSVAMLLTHLTASDHQTEVMTYVARAGTVASILLFVTICVLAIGIHRFLLLKEGKKFDVAAITKITFLTLLMYLSLPYLQARINMAANTRGPGLAS